MSCAHPQAKLESLEAQVQQLQADLAESERARAGLQAQVYTLGGLVSGCSGPASSTNAGVAADTRTLELQAEVQVGLRLG